MEQGQDGERSQKEALKAMVVSLQKCPFQKLSGRLSISALGNGVVSVPYSEKKMHQRLRIPRSRRGV